MRVEPGVVVGRWTLVRALGAGAFGTTWVAEDPRGRRAALKVLAGPPGDEARALARVCHPGVVAFYDSGAGAVPYLAMELAEGRSLASFLRSARTPEHVATAAMAVLLDALAAVHDAGIVHGDIKPDNLIVTSTNPVRLALVDFGAVGQAEAGTLCYAAPERTSGGESTTASDVYSAGLVVWELLHGSPPWSELSVSEALLRRRSAAPVPTRGPAWLQELVGRMLAVCPAHRPTAHEVADACAAQGVPLAEVDGAWLSRRAASVHVAPAAAMRSVEQWLVQGGTVAFTGHPGSGRTHLLDAITAELQARGAAFVRLRVAPGAWQPIVEALEDPSLPGAPQPLPQTGDTLQRAATAAERLLARGPAEGHVHVLVDDPAALDGPSRVTLEALSRLPGIALCVAGDAAPEWAGTAVVLDPFEEGGLSQLAVGILGGSSPPEGLVRRLGVVSAGRPGAAVAALLAAVEEGALVRRARRWVLDRARFDALQVAGRFDRGPALRLDPDTRAVGALMAVHGLPLAAGAIVLLTGQSEVLRPLRLLVDLGLVRECDGRFAITSTTAGAALRDGADLPGLHAAILARLPADAPAARVARHAAGAGDAPRAREIGVRGVTCALENDAAEAAHLSDLLWPLAPSAELAAVRAAALIAAGRVADARSFAAGHLGDREPGPADVGLLLHVARLHAQAGDEQAAADACLAMARRALRGRPPPDALILEEARIHMAAGRHADAVASARQIADTAVPRRAGDPGVVDRWLTARLIWAQALHASGSLDDGIRVLAQIPPEVGAGRAPRAEVEGGMARLLWHAGRLREAATALLRAAEADGGLPTSTRARILNNLGLVRYQTGDRAGALTAWEDALVLFERLGSKLDQVRAEVNLCVGYREAGRAERARQAGVAAEERAHELGAFELEAMAAGNLGDVYLGAGDYPRAEAAFDRAGTLAAAHALDGERVELARRRAELAVLRKAPDAIRIARTAVRVARVAKATFDLAKAHALLAVCLARCGQTARLGKLAADATEPLLKAGAAGELADVRLWLAEAFLAGGAITEAADHLMRVELYAREVGNAALQRRADQLGQRVRAVQSDARGRFLDPLDLAVAVARERDIEVLLTRVAESGRALMDADRCFVLLMVEGEPIVASTALAEGATPGEPSMSVVRRALEDQREIIAADLGERGDILANQSVRVMDLRSVMCVPMIDGEVTVGVIYVDSRHTNDQRLGEAVRMMRALAAQAAIALANARHLQVAARRAERAADLAHDLRSPMYAAVEIARGLLARGADPATEDALREIIEECRRATEMSARCLDERPPVRGPFDLAALVARVAVTQQRIASPRGIRISAIGDAEVWVGGEPEEVRRAIDNLVWNAVKYCGEGGTVVLDLRAGDAGVVLNVRDQGTGLPQGGVEHLFERSVQAPGALPGHGLGLTIARRIIGSHGGSITAANHPDGGAVFTVTLPGWTHARAAARGAT